MVEESDWEFPEEVRPKPADLDYDLDRALASVVSLRAEIPEDAFTASILGTERAGNGVVIDDDGLILTIGYVIAEASEVWLVTNAGTAAGAHVVAYDFDTGFGLVQALGELGAPSMKLGRSSACGAGDSVVLAGHGGRRHAIDTRIVSKREFAGYWEYVLDEAIFTAPAHPNWGGAAMIDAGGRLQGIGSLLVQNSRGGEAQSDGNMIVPIDLLPPILEDLLQYGAVKAPPRPWLGIYVAEAEERLVVVGLAGDGPAERAGILAGDVVVEVGGAPIGDLADLFRSIWALGPAGSDIALTVWREGKALKLVVASSDRAAFLKSPRLH
ncbi:MAG: S1C family serine protease [Alphaproteobacteria bacterium]